MATLRPSRIDTPPEHAQRLAYGPLSWLAYDAANPSIEVPVEAINEFNARVAGGISLRLPAWRVRVRPALRSSLQA